MMTNQQLTKSPRRFWRGMAVAALAIGTGAGGYTAASAMGMTGATGDETVELTSADVPVDDQSPGVPQTEADEQNPAGTPGTSPQSPSQQPAVDGGTPVPGAAMTVEQANASVIRIEATGEFIDPEFGSIEGVGSGSGFIIDGTGIAVTNNHVVAGAAFLEVFVPGEDQPRNARILGTSECSDLAVIDIDGDGFPVVALNMTAPTIGTDVFAAGYPLGDPEFTLTKGIVSKAETRGDTPLSSVDGVLEHDANINPGNSGGPLFDYFGQVVGVNYQRNSATAQSFAITSANALPIIDQLREGVSVDSIGINGQIVNLGDRYGLFVASVETGSTADRVGIIGGDVILELEHVAVSTDGTMGDYCDVLRTNGTDVPLDITVLRPGLDQLLFGTLNDEALVVSFDGGQMMEDAGMDTEYQTGPAAPTAPATAGYQLTTDDTGTVSVEVPTAWAQVATGPLGVNQDLPNVTASADLDSFENQWVTGGLQLTAFDGSVYEYNSIWDQRNQLTDNCGTVEAAEPIDLAGRAGLIRIAVDCGPEGTASLVLFQVEPGDSDYFASGIIQVVTQEDIDAIQRVLVSFDVA